MQARGQMLKEPLHITRPYEPKHRKPSSKAEQVAFFGANVEVSRGD